MTGNGIDPGRRNFLRGRTRATPAPVRPPWSLPDRFTALCSRCGRCATACPEGIIRPGTGGFPEVDFGRGECTFCAACAAACPEPRLFALLSADTCHGGTALVPPWHVVAAIGETCLATRRIVCRSCRDTCPHAAVRVGLEPGGTAHLDIDPAACTGCGACVSACPVGAVTMGGPDQPAGTGHDV